MHLSITLQADDVLSRLPKLCAQLLATLSLLQHLLQLKVKTPSKKTAFVYRSYDLRDTCNSLPTFLTHDLFIWSS